MAVATPIRVLVVDDSLSVRTMLRALLEADARIEVIGEAEDGVQAVAMTKRLKPDVVTMDIHMPRMGGIEAIGEIMASAAVRILVVSGQSDAQLACEAIACGALDVMDKPDLSQGAALVAKIKLLAGVPVITHIRSRARPRLQHQDVSPLQVVKPTDESHRLVFAIAASTGGPQALCAILGALPSDFPNPVLVAQHIAVGFAPGLAEWLDSNCRLPVRLAKQGDVLEPGVIYVSPSESNLVVTHCGHLMLEDLADRQVFHPSCDRLLCSVADTYGSRAVGIILTGMSRDGVAGITHIARSQGTTLAQDEESSAVFGMNREAIKTGHVQKVVALTKVAEKMCDLSTAAARSL